MESWKLAIKDAMVQDTIVLTAPGKLALDYLKCRLVPGQTYALPSELGELLNDPLTESPCPSHSRCFPGVPREVFPDEKRVAQTPSTVALLVKKGFRVVVALN